jgi:FkbH-like protein
MKLAEALAISNKALPPDCTRRAVFLVCGFTPLYLETFLKAFLALRFPESNVHIETGLFGDITGNLERAAGAGAGEAAVVLEWQDLDPRLGWRHAGGWGERAALEIPAGVSARFEQILAGLRNLAGHSTVVLSPPALPLPPLSHTAPVQAGGLELELQLQLAQFLRRASELDHIRIISRTWFDQLSSPAGRLDLKLELSSGFPYRVAHASALAESLTAVLFPKPPKKGLITDLDDVLWRGLVGEVGAEGISWTLDTHSQAHALYQQTLAALAEYGVLVAVASKNDPSAVSLAFDRKDLLIAERQIFPIEVHWGAKSESVGRILEAWNIGADSVVFVDDSPIEIAEVRARFPEIEGLVFPAQDPEGIWQLIRQLRTLFGKTALFAEDRIRAASLRTSAAFQPHATTGASTDFLAAACATITFDRRRNSSDTRALELINKTNQFNLNGRRWTEAEWRAGLENPHRLALAVSYEDKFGPLGKIAVVGGAVCGSKATVDVWVMSCRAFSRRIEYHTLNHIFSAYNVDEIVLNYAPTSRNKPLREFLESVAAVSDSAQPVVSRRNFAASSPVLPHSIREIS